MITIILNKDLKNKTPGIICCTCVNVGKFLGKFREPESDRLARHSGCLFLCSKACCVELFPLGCACRYLPGPEKGKIYRGWELQKRSCLVEKAAQKPPASQQGEPVCLELSPLF